MLLNKLSPETIKFIRKLGFFSVYFAVLVIPGSYYLATKSSIPDFWAFAPFLFLFGVIPFFDFLMGLDTVNEHPEDEKRLVESKIYRWLTIAVLPIQIAVIAFGMWVFMTYEGFSIFGQLLWIMNIGIVGGVLAINVGHELIHKDPKIENWTGGLLYSLVSYSGFKVEHVRGHHVNVSTPLDASSSRYNQSLYHFLPRAYWHNYTNAWKLEAKRLERKGLSVWSYRNELIWWNAFTLFCAALSFAVFGWMGVLFFFAQGFMAFTTLEIINYVEHYGLHRRVLENGRYERTTPAHSWNCSYFLSNVLLFQLQRHSDHHAHPKRRYQILRHYDESPQLPAGYPVMFLLAFVPPLWKKVMNPRVEQYYQNEKDQLFRKPNLKVLG